MSNGNRIRGIDVSIWRETVNWKKVLRDPSKVKFAITKATDGVGWTDPTFDANWVGMRRVDLVRGAFHFFQPGIDAVAQADYFLGVMEGIYHSYDLPLIVDVEPTKFNVDTWKKLSSSELAKRLRRCIERVEQGSGGKPILYTNFSTWKDWFKDSKAFIEYPLWVANYTTGSPLVPAGNWGGKGWAIWQFSEDGTCEGVNPPVDLNWFDGTVEDMRRVFGMTPMPSSPPVCSNRDMVMAFQKVAEQFNQNFEVLLDSAGLGGIHQIAGNRGRVYEGPAIEDLPGLTSEMKEALRKALEKPEPETPLVTPASGDATYPELDLTNQKMINAFFQAAQPFGEDGWLWIEGNDLAHMAIPDGNRNLIYVGPCVENLPNLAEDKKAALLEALGLPSTHVLQPSGGGTYPNLTNQDMIDAMERAASRFGQSGIDWIRRSGLTFITTPATNLGKPYAGPPIKEIPGLADEHKKALRRQVISKIG